MKRCVLLLPAAKLIAELVSLVEAKADHPTSPKDSFIHGMERIQVKKNDGDIEAVTPAMLFPLLDPLLSRYGLQNCNVSTALSILHKLALPLLADYPYPSTLSWLEEGFQKRLGQLPSHHDDDFSQPFWSTWNYLKAMIALAILPPNFSREEVLYMLSVRGGKIPDKIFLEERFSATQPSPQSSVASSSLSPNGTNSTSRSIFL